MAKKRTRPVTPPMRDNPLDMGLVSSIGSEPGARVLDAEPEPPARSRLPDPEPVVEPREPKPQIPARSQERVSASARPRPQTSRPTRSTEKDTYQHKTRFSPMEYEQVEAFRITLENKLNVKLKGAQISRMLWTLALRAEEELDNVPTPDLRRPSYGDTLGMAAFEDEIADYLLLALKKTRRH